MRRSLCLALALGALGCAPAPDSNPSTSDTPGAFGLNPAPLVQIGVSDGPMELQFHKAISAHRLADGRIVVSNGGTTELRWYAPDGAYLLAAGRAGQGPGEFRGTPTLFAWPGDSIAAYDPTLERLSLFSADGVAGRTVASGAPVHESYPWFPWVHRRTVVMGTRTATDRACVLAALAVMPLPPPDAGMRFLHVDRAGRFWVREGLAGQAQWTVWQRDGTLLGSAPVGSRFDLLDAGTDFAVGRVPEEADDTERIVTFAITDQRPVGECLPGDAQPVPVEVPPGIRRQLMMLVTGQEAGYADRGSYTSHADSVMIPIDPLYVLWILQADRSGWAGALLERESEISCAISMGNIIPGGWRDGTLTCG